MNSALALLSSWCSQTPCQSKFLFPLCLVCFLMGWAWPWKGSTSPNSAQAVWVGAVPLSHCMESCICVHGHPEWFLTLQADQGAGAGSWSSPPWHEEKSGRCFYSYLQCVSGVWENVSTQHMLLSWGLLFKMCLNTNQDCEGERWFPFCSSFGKGGGWTNLWEAELHSGFYFVVWSQKGWKSFLSWAQFDIVEQTHQYTSKNKADTWNWENSEVEKLWTREQEYQCGLEALFVLGWFLQNVTEGLIPYAQVYFYSRGEVFSLLFCGFFFPFREVSSGFFYKSAEEREKLVKAERKFIEDRVNKIIELKRKVCGDSDKGFVVINQKVRWRE